MLSSSGFSLNSFYLLRDPWGRVHVTLDNATTMQVLLKTASLNQGKGKVRLWSGGRSWRSKSHNLWQELDVGGLKTCEPVRGGDLLKSVSMPWPVLETINLYPGRISRGQRVHNTDVRPGLRGWTRLSVKTRVSNVSWESGLWLVRLGPSQASDWLLPVTVVKIVRTWITSCN